MKYCWILLLLSALSGVSLGDDTCSDVVAYTSVWNAGASGKITVTFPSAVSSWTIAITFTSTKTDFQVWVGDNIQCSGTTCTFENMSWNGNQAAGSTLGIDFLYYFDSTSEISGVSIDGTDVCGTNSGGSDTTRYVYFFFCKNDLTISISYKKFITIALLQQKLQLLLLQQQQLQSQQQKVLEQQQQVLVLLQGLYF